MAETTKIGWCLNSDGSPGATFNPWVGCTKVSPGCVNCYAESWAKRAGKHVWGPGKDRQRTTDANWRQPLKWDKAAAKNGIRQRIFCSSLADVFDNEAHPQWRDDLWSLVRATPNCDWVLVTKRIGNAPKMLPADWGSGYPNVWIVATVVNQLEADRDIPKLLAVPAVVHGLSIEPMLGPINIEPHLISCEGCGNQGSQRIMVGYDQHAQSLCGRVCDRRLVGGEGPRLDWVIIGGENAGRDKARSMDIAWVHDLLRQTSAAGVPTFVKQLGSYPKAGRFDDHYTGRGDDPSEWPADIRVRQVPFTKVPR